MKARSGDSWVLGRHPRPFDARRKKASSALVAALTVTLLALGTTLAFASSVDESIVDTTAPTGSVSLAPGASGAITINLSVTGKQDGTATFDVDRDWALSGGTFTGSNPTTFTVLPRAATDAATTFSTVGTVTVDSGQGIGTFTLAVGAFNITNTNTMGAKLSAGVSTSYSVTVTSPPPPSDTTPPSISYVLDPTSPDGSNGWYNGEVTLTWTVTENESPNSLSKTGCVDQDITADQAETTYSCSATSEGGSAGPVNVSIKRDGTAPTVAYTSASGTAGNAGWYTSAVTATFTATDNLSGFDSSGSLTATDTNTSGSSEGAGISIGSPAFADYASNTVAAGAATHSFNVDLTNPTVACNSAPTFLLNQSGAQVSAVVTDDQSGPFASPVTAAADTSAVGSFTQDVTGYDVAGRSRTVSCGYKVAYGFVGFTSPVDNPGVLNAAKAGQAIPLKWRLLDANNVPVTNLSSVTFTVSSLSCSLGTTTDLVEEYAAGSSGLQNLGDGYYQFNWKTPTSYANSCKTLKLDLGEGAGNEHTALFQFRK